jgi:mycothiol synthase
VDGQYRRQPGRGLVAARGAAHGGGRAIAVHIRAASGSEDLAAWAEVKNQLTPLDRVTPHELEHELATNRDIRLLLATMDGEVVGSGIGRNSQAAPDSLFAMVRVVPAHRRRGAGSAILSVLSEVARERGLSHLFGRIQEDDADSLAWARRRGMTEIARETSLLLALADMRDAAPPAPPPGVELVSLAERPDLGEGAHRVESEAILDIPGPFPLSPVSFEEWRAENVDVPGFQPAGSFVALLHGEPVGYAGLTAQDQDLAEHLLTGVLRAARGRGIATALKRAQIEWARRVGIRQLVTWTSSRNDPMRFINLKLGYVEQPASIAVRGAVPASTGTHAARIGPDG